jgi:hypothetical protein
MILEGWHRYLACLATKTQPKFAEFKGSDLEAAERVHASGIRRQSSADLRYASFVLLCDACPEFKAKYEDMKQKGTQQQQAGKPVSTDGQRVDVLKAKAKAAGTSKGTAAKVERINKVKPEAVAEIAGGKTSANKVLKGMKEQGSGNGKPTDAKQGNADGPLKKLKSITHSLRKSLKTFLACLGSVDWSKEDETTWTKAGESLARTLLDVNAMVMKGFDDAKKKRK